MPLCEKPRMARGKGQELARVDELTEAKRLRESQTWPVHWGFVSGTVAGVSNVLRLVYRMWELGA